MATAERRTVQKTSMPKNEEVKTWTWKMPSEKQELKMQAMW
jgi:hypothetical protein